MTVRWILAFLACLAAGCEESPKPIAPIAQSGELVVLTVNGPATYFEDAQGHPSGFEYDLAMMFARELGSDMGFLAWKDAGVNPYGNSVIANGPWLKANHDKADKFVKITQKAFAECAKTPDPCIKALVEANGALVYQNELDNWHLVTMLMSDETSRTVALVSSCGLGTTTTASLPAGISTSMVVPSS